MNLSAAAWRQATHDLIESGRTAIAPGDLVGVNGAINAMCAPLPEGDTPTESTQPPKARQLQSLKPVFDHR